MKPIEFPPLDIDRAAREISSVFTQEMENIRFRLESEHEQAVDIRVPVQQGLGYERIVEVLTVLDRYRTEALALYQNELARAFSCQPKPVYLVPVGASPDNGLDASCLPPMPVRVTL